MSRQTLFVFLSVLFSLSVLGQSEKIDISEEYKLPVKSEINSMIGYDQSGYYILQRTKKSECVVTKFDFNQSLRHSKELFSYYNGKRTFSMDVKMLNDKLYLFSSIDDIRNGKYYLFCQNIDKNSFELTGQQHTLSEIEHVYGSRAENWEIVISFDQQRILLYSKRNEKKSDRVHYEIIVMNGEMKTVWQNRIEIPYSPDFFEDTELWLSNDGTVVLNGKLYDDKPIDRKRGKKGFVPKSFLCTGKGSNVKELNINLGDKLISEIKIISLTKSELACKGFYSDINTKGLAGVFSFLYDIETGKVRSLVTSGLSLNEITKYWKDKEVARAEARAEKGLSVELFDYKLKDIVFNEDSSYYMIAEECYTIDFLEAVSKDSPYQRVPHYYYDDIIIIKVSANGKILWADKILKKQENTYDLNEYHSYAYAVNKGNLYFVFNDHKSNANKSESRKLTRYTYSGRKDGYTVLVKINNKGEQDKSRLFDNGTITRLAACGQINNNLFIIHGLRNSKNKFAKISF